MDHYLYGRTILLLVVQSDLLIKVVRKWRE